MKKTERPWPDDTSTQLKVVGALRNIYMSLFGSAGSKIYERSKDVDPTKELPFFYHMHNSR